MIIKLTKTELRIQQLKAAQLKRYLPTLQLKKALLQIEVSLVQQKIEELNGHFKACQEKVADFSPLFSDRGIWDLFTAVKIHEVKRSTENIAGIDVPVFEGVLFGEVHYSLFDSPFWLDAAISSVRDLLTSREKVKVAQEKKAALQKELKEVSIRVNLFEKILIPRAEENIKKIKIFLGDQQLSAVCQAKVSKQKIIARSSMRCLK